MQSLTAGQIQLFSSWMVAVKPGMEAMQRRWSRPLTQAQQHLSLWEVERQESLHIH